METLLSGYSQSHTVGMGVAKVHFVMGMSHQLVLLRVNSLKLKPCTE